MTPGPPPTPTATLKLRRSWRANRNPAEPKGDGKAPTCPSWLDAEGKKAWRYMAKILKRRGTISSEDQHALAMYCAAWSRYLKAEAFLQKNGSVRPVKNYKGEVIGEKPWSQHGIQRDLAKQLRAYQQEFGLTPSARSRIVASGAEREPEHKSKFFAAG